MTLQVIGAGLPRTGTTSLRAALESLLGEPCYHMRALGEHPEHGRLWNRALAGDTAALDTVLGDYVAAVDWPASLFWRDLSERHPDAMVLLSHRGNAETWWASADRTVWALMRLPDADRRFTDFHASMRGRAGLGMDWDEPEAAMAFYDAHMAEVIDTIPADRLLLWQPGDGWEPICEALGLPVPNEAFGHLNDGAEFRAKSGLDTSLE